MRPKLILTILIIIECFLLLILFSPSVGMSKQRIAVLVSGGGTTLENFVARIADGRLEAEIGLVIASKASAYALERCRNHGLDAEVIEWTGDGETFSAALTERIDTAQVDLVCMAGFLRKWAFPDRWYGRVINIHPGLLPDYGGKGMYGHHVHEAVIAAGEPESGCSVHIANLEYDQGPLILQRRVPVLPADTADTLAARVFEAECEAYPEAVTLFAEGRVQVDGDRVTILAAG